jgi:hypothetical protein
MAEVLNFLKSAEPWIYIILVTTGLLVLRRLIRSWQEWQSSVFGLEKENAQRRFTASLSILILLFLLGVAEFATASIVFPDFPAAQAVATPTIELVSTPTVAAEAIESSTPTPAEALVVQQPLEEGCVAGQIEWLYPTNGTELQGEVDLRGTVSVPNLGFYKYEYNQSGTDTWVTIAAGDKPIVDQPLGGSGSGSWDTSQLVPGDYLLRIVVTDNVNNLFPACIISVRVVAP